MKNKTSEDTAVMQCLRLSLFYRLQDVIAVIRCPMQSALWKCESVEKPGGVCKRRCFPALFIKYKSLEEISIDILL